MPEMTFHVRWPDGEAARCWSPSLVVREHLEAGRSYTVDDFVERSRTALTTGSERVRERYGVACASALAQLEQIERTAARFDGAAPVRVISC